MEAKIWSMHIVSVLGVRT